MPGISLRERVDAVVIGASAGGVEALSVLLPALPPDSSAAIFIVLHIPRDKPSLLAQIFANKCALPVREAEDKEPVAPGTVYFAPSNYHLLLDRGPQTALSADDPVHHSRPSIDVLFESAVETDSWESSSRVRTRTAPWGSPRFTIEAASRWCSSRRRRTLRRWPCRRSNRGPWTWCCRCRASWIFWEH
jgi:CheB methylesterase